MKYRLSGVFEKAIIDRYSKGTITLEKEYYTQNTKAEMRKEMPYSYQEYEEKSKRFAGFAICRRSRGNIG